MNKKIKLLMWVVVTISYIGLAISYFFLPDNIPIHWNNNWEVDNFANKNFIFLLGLMPIVLVALFDYLPHLDPRGTNIRKNSKEYVLMKYVVVLLLVFGCWASVLTALDVNINFKLIFPIILGIALIILGNYMPKVRSNFFLGIKNPWVLSNETVWRKTHKMGGYLFFVTGLLMLLMGFINNTNYNIIVITLLILGIVAVNVYSYVLYKKLQV